ncbi:hypothetical protein IB233_03135 [Comamonas sp. CMM01]|uniref:hypothetical protein n=1 Tax=Comamonas sp. CMM01 TaxID=2769280 RepID=UPI00177CCCA8|nr:hypothetical protein [Comamonas sp. CMM01]MBD9530627.1 hypothetical protein [Comamonas sp. CMM01]
MRKRNAALLITCAGVSFFAVYLVISSPKGVVITEDGAVKGLLNVARSGLQGTKFWQQQRQAVLAEIAWLEGQPERSAGVRKRIAELDATAEARLQEAYAKHPSIKPSAAQQRADELREEADRIEQDELDMKFEQACLRQIQHLQRLISIINSKL